MTKPQSPAWWLYRGCRYWLHWPVDSMAQHSGDFRPHSPCCIISYWNCYTSLQPSPKIQWFCSKYTRTRVSDSILTNTDLPYLDKCSSAQTKQSEEYLSLSKLQRKKKKKKEEIMYNKTQCLCRDFHRSLVLLFLLHQCWIEANDYCKRFAKKKKV